jgi:hypothetical protein
VHVQKGSCMRICFAIVIARGPLQSWSLNCPAPVSAAACHWHFVDNQLSPLPAGAMSCLYTTLFRASPRICRASPPHASILRATRLHRTHLPRYYTAHSNMSDLFVELTAPNGRKYKQPRGLFINNEFVKSKSGETITTINPRYMPLDGSLLYPC